MIRFVLRISIGLFLLFPFLTLILHFGSWSAVDAKAVGKALEFSFLQSSLSAAASVALGISGALGLNYWSRHSHWIRILFLLPNFIPPLFVAVAALYVIRPFPFGVPGIVILNTMINSGLCAVIIYQLLQDRVGGWAELALVEGASRGRFLLTTLNYLKFDLFLIGFFVFCLCFSSLTVPLLAGRFDVATLELLIWEKISTGDNWAEVLSLSVLQSLIIFLLGISFRLPTTQSVPSTRCLKLLQAKWGILPPLLISVVILLELFTIAPLGYLQTRDVLWALLPSYHPVFNSLLIGFSVGVGTFFGVGLICYSLPDRNFEKFLSAYIAPSTALTAFSFYLLDWPITLPLVVLALVCLFLPIVFRLNLSSGFRAIRDQIEVARVMGASPLQIFADITLPLLARPMGIAAGLASFWAVGDFIVSGLLMPDSPNLAIISKRLLEGYRLEASSFFVLLLLLMGSAFLILFWSVGNVLSDRPLSRLRRL